MKLVFKILFVIPTLFFIGCSFDNQKTPKLVKIGNVSELEQIIKIQTPILELTPETALTSIINFYLESDKTPILTNETPIPLYVLYSLDNWKMDMKTFQMMRIMTRIMSCKTGRTYQEYRQTLILIQQMILMDNIRV